jgi:hypothetical protein
MRWRGRVVRVEWVPDVGQRAELRQGSLTPRKLFRERLVEDFHHRPGFGLAAVVASKLRRKKRRP